LRSSPLQIAALGLSLSFASPGLPASSLDADLDQFKQVFIDRDRALADGARIDAENQLATLRQHAGSMTTEQIRLALMRIVALADNAGSLVLDNPQLNSIPRLPIRLGWFPDGWLVLHAQPDQNDLVGARLLAIDGIPMDDVASKLSPFYGGLQSRRMTTIPMLIERPSLLSAAGIGHSPDLVTVTLRLVDGRTVVRSIGSIPPTPTPFWPDRWSPDGFEADQHWSHAVDPAQLPLFLQEFEQPHRTTYVPDIRGAYLQVKWTPKAREASVKDLAQSLIALREKNPANFIADLRFDHGGSTPELIALLKSETAYYRDHGAAIWILTGRHTHESGIVAVAAVKSAANGRATIVGESVGDHLAFWASAGRDCLDGLGICIIHAARRFDVANGCGDPSCQDEYRGYRVATLEPDIPVDMTIASYLVGKDPMMEAIRAQISGR